MFPQLCCRSPLGSNQRGVALITAMLVAVLVTAGAVALATTQRFSMQRGFNQMQQSELTRLVYQGENRATLALSEDKLKNGTDSLDEIWATDEIEITNQHSRLTARVVDQQGLFNLTNLAQQFGAGTRAAAPAAGAQTAGEGGVAAESTPTALSPSAPAATVSPSRARSRHPPATSMNNPANNPALPDREDVFDWTQHRDFVDSYVSTCEDANYKCAEQAIALAYQQSTSNPVNSSARGQSDNAASPVAAASNATPRFPGSLTISPDLTSASGVAPAAGTRSGTESLDPQAQLSALFRALDLDLAPIQAILDWIDEDSETRYPNGAEDEYYTGLDSPYRAANGPLATVRELLLVRGITTKVFEKLAPHICVLPQKTPININTASAEVLMALHPMIGRSTAELLIDARKAQTFQSNKSFLEHPALFGISLPDSIVTTSSDYFKLNATATVGDFETYHRTLVRRVNTDVSVLRREKTYLN